MSASCCVPDCYNRAACGRKSLYRQSDAVSYHPLPRDTNSRQKWTRILKIDDVDRQSADLYVCSRHFKSRDFVNKRLKPTAVPFGDRGKSNDELETLIKDCRVRISSDDRQLAENRLKSKVDDVEEPPIYTPTTSPNSSNLVVKSSLCTKADLNEIRKRPLPSSTVWRVIVPAPPSGQLNSENFIKSIVSKLPDLKRRMNSSSSTTTLPKSRKLIIKEKPAVSPSNDDKTVTESTSKRARVEPSIQIESYCSLRDESTVSGKGETSPPKNDFGMREIYVRKIRTLQQIKRRMNDRIVELSKRVQILQESQCNSNGCKTVEHIIIIETMPKCGCSSSSRVDESETAKVPVDDLETVLRTAVETNVPPLSESRRLAMEREKLLKKIASIKRGMKNKDILRCVVVETEEIT